MNLIGERIIHKSKRSGTIKAIVGNKIEIIYDDNPTGKPGKFHYPGAFANGFLKFEKENLNGYIESVISENTCEFCKNSMSQTEIIDGKHICLDCKKKLSFICPWCKEYHLEENSVIVDDHILSTHKTKICKNCAESKSFICDHCGKRLPKSKQSHSKLNDKILCEKCSELIVKTCSFCGKEFDIDEGDYFPGYKETKYVCPECLEDQTFICSKCGSRELISNLASSKFVSKDELICTGCTRKCSICKSDIDEKHTYEAFGERYCPDCWDKYMKICPICKDEFVDLASEKEVCPDCEVMQEYVERIEGKDFSGRIGRDAGAFFKYTDRCKLFTELYENCHELDGGYRLVKNQNPFHYIIMEAFGLKMIITWLPKDIIGLVKDSLNITMTEFQKTGGLIKVYEAVRYWISLSTQSVMIPDGKMRILNYPVKFRVQTEYNKVYGKHWNGPDDYIEIGNYGDTTNFYIIGVLEGESLDKVISKMKSMRETLGE